MAAVKPVDPRIDSMFEFIETHAGITFRNLQLFYGDLIREFGVNEEVINAECTTRGQSKLSDETEDSDYIFEAPINAFDGGELVPITPDYVAGIVAKVKKLRPLRPIVLNEENTDFSSYLQVDLDSFRGSIPKLETTYTKIKGNEKTSRVREMLEDFQPMFLERYSNYILDLLKTTDGKRVFTTMTEFIRAFTDPTFASMVSRMDHTNADLSQMSPQKDSTWQGMFGGIHLIIHVVPGRQPTGKGSTISAANVIQAAVFYKDRKNDFVRGQGALTMIKQCKTEWPRGDVSHKNGTEYSFSDLYTGELIVQNYDGVLPNFPDYSDGKPKVKNKAEEVPFVIPPEYSNDAFVSILPIVHQSSAAKKIFTNQEHIFAVYPASCAFHDWCYYETLIQNLQMISATANGEVNQLIYESPIGKIQYVYDCHENNLKRYIGGWWTKRIELFKNAMGVCPTTEFSDKLPSEITDLQTKIDEIKAEDAKNAPRLAILTKSSKTKDELKEFSALTQLKLSNDDNLVILEALLPQIPQKQSVTPNVIQFEINKKKYLDFIGKQEFHTRKAMLMKRLSTLEECALVYDDHEESILHRRSVVMSCIHSVGIIVECAKIGVATTTLPTSEHKRLVSESNHVTALRKLSYRLFSDYQQYKAQVKDVSDAFLGAIEPLLELIQHYDRLKEGIKLVLVDNVVLSYKSVWGELLNKRSEIQLSIINETDERMSLGHDYHVVRKEQELKYSGILTEINLEMLAAITKMNDDYSSVAYLLENLSELGAVNSLDLFQTSEKMNVMILQLLDKLLTVPSISTPEQKDRMLLLLKTITRPESTSTVLVTHHAERAEMEKEVVVEKFGVRLKEDVNEVYALLPEGVSYKSAVNIAMTLIGNEPRPDVPKPSKGFSWGDRQIVAQGVNAKFNAFHRSATERENRLSQRVLRIAMAKKADDAYDAYEVKQRTKQADALEGLMYMYNFVNEPKKPSEEMRAKIVAEVNANAEIATAARDLMTIMERLSGPFQPNTTGTLSLVESELPEVRPFHLSSFRRGGGGEFVSQMNKAIDNHEIPTMYDLYIDHFDSQENDYDTCILLNQAYCILMKHDIYVPLYRCDTTKTIEEMVHPMLEKRRDYRGDFYDFDSVFADSFCIQIFGKNVNELLDDLSKGSLNVPRGAFPNISANPFEPVSLICILETVLFLCNGLPFATRLHVYFAGVLSFMNQSYSNNIDGIQTDQVLDYLKDPNFFQCFHKAARMYNERFGESSEPTDHEPEKPAPVFGISDVSAMGPDTLESPVVPPVPLESQVEQVPPPGPSSHDPAEDPRSVGTPLYQKKHGDYGGTRRYRRKKTKRHTLNKRFKRNRTRRLH